MFFFWRCHIGEKKHGTYLIYSIHIWHMFRFCFPMVGTWPGLQTPWRTAAGRDCWDPAPVGSATEPVEAPPRSRRSPPNGETVNSLSKQRVVDGCYMSRVLSESKKT